MRKIKKGDDIIILAGKDKGKRGTVTKLVGQSRVHVQGVNTVKKHQKPNPSTGASGGIVNIDLPIHISNVALFNFTSKKKIGLALNMIRIKKRSAYLDQMAKKFNIMIGQQ